MILAGSADAVSGTERPYAYFRRHFDQGAPWTFLVQNKVPRCCIMNAILETLFHLPSSISHPGRHFSAAWQPPLPHRPADHERRRDDEQILDDVLPLERGHPGDVFRLKRHVRQQHERQEGASHL